MVTLESLQYFFDSYAERKSSESNANLQKLACFASEYTPILEQSRKHAQVNAPHFNIFNVLGVSHYEVTTHSAFLRELLDSSGTHGQGNLFFRMFLEYLSSKGCIDSSDISAFTDDIYDDYICITEQVVSSGRLDIVIERRGVKRSFCIYIENKIYALDQDRQLERYWDELQQIEAAKHRKILIYLTIDGHAPISCFLNKSKILCLSYNKDINSWLQNCRDRILSEKVKYALDQYLLTITNF